MRPSYRAILLLGPPGSGKGTQGRILGSIPGFFHCACGDVFRSLDLQSDLGRTFLRHSSCGKLVPDELTVALWQRSIRAFEVARRFDADRSVLVLDGIPRTLGQAKLLDEMINVVKVVNLVCPDRNVLVERMQRRALKDNRVDDAKEQTIQHRLDVYDREVGALLSHYGAERVAAFDATRSPLSVLTDIVTCVGPEIQRVFSGAAASEATMASVQ